MRNGYSEWKLPKNNTLPKAGGAMLQELSTGNRLWEVLEVSEDSAKFSARHAGQVRDFKFFMGCWAMVDGCLRHRVSVEFGAFEKFIAPTEK